MIKCTAPGCHGWAKGGSCGVCGLVPEETRAPQDTYAPPPVSPQGYPGASRGRPWTPRTHDQGGGAFPRKDPEPAKSGPDRWRSSPPTHRASSEVTVPTHSDSESIKLSGHSGPGSITDTVGTADSAALSSRSNRGSVRGMLGMGMVQVPPVPYRDPAEAVMTDPVVSEKSRFCGNCGEKVGRSRDGRTGRTEGFCRRCGTQFSFSPKLAKGDLVGGQYEVLGCLAHGGLGWIYLARDRNVNDRWVVLKGLLNAGDAEAHKAAAAERAFLSEVEHPNIVKIINFSQHPDPRTGIPGGLIVMEYVGGKSLRELLVERREEDSADDVLPLEQVIAYGLECLRALGHLHSKGMLYCDFKPENVIQSEEQIKLIDLGGVRRMDDMVSSVYTTPGYRVPDEELRGPGPSISTDLYSVGRALAVLSFKFNFIREHPYSLPPRTSVPLLRHHESFDRLLRRATHIEPERRFHDAGEMADQLTGVLREVLSEQKEVAHPAASTLFDGENFSGADVGPQDADELLTAPSPTMAARMLPTPLIDLTDPAAQLLRGFATLPPRELVTTLRSARTPTPETWLMLTRVLITEGHRHEAMDALQQFSRTAPGDWRTMWYLAVAELSAGRFEEARHHFDELYGHLPGEAAPKLGLAVACEHIGELETAARQYRTIWNTDHSFVSAAFGLARVRIAQGLWNEAIAVLDTVPELSSLHVHAQAAMVAVLADQHRSIDTDDFVWAGHRLEQIGLGSEATDRLAVRVLEAALLWLETGGRTPDGQDLLGGAFTEEAVRSNLEERCRALANRAAVATDRYELIDKANSLRPVTLL